MTIHFPLMTTLLPLLATSIYASHEVKIITTVDMAVVPRAESQFFSFVYPSNHVPAQTYNYNDAILLQWTAGGFSGGNGSLSLYGADETIGTFSSHALHPRVRHGSSIVTCHQFLRPG